jgi:D-sedoheptulose 7-phosphate isomerase
MSDYIDSYLAETKKIAETIDRGKIEAMLEALQRLKDSGGRLFILGVGGSAGNSSHAVNDFRKISGIECYAPTDNVSELTAWTNDNGWEWTFINWLKTSKLSSKDAVLVLSVGGGSDKTSKNLVLAMEHAKSVGAKILAIVSRDGGKAGQYSEVCVLVPVVNKDRITPHAEGWQGVVWHLLCNAIR